MLNLTRRSRLPVGAVSKVLNLKAPVGGFNTRDQYSDMPPTDAVQLINWIPSPAGITARGGYQAWREVADGTAIQSLIHYFSSTDTIPSTSLFVSPTNVPGKLWAATKSGIYDVTDSGNTAATVALALSGADEAGYIHSTMFSNIAGSFLVACSETDGYHIYDGSSWSKVTPAQVTNVNPNDLCFPLSWKKRLWFVEQESTCLWYLPVDSIYGAAVKLDVGPLVKRGGKVEFIANWTIDAGEGIDDLLVIVCTNGDVLVYKGTDPSSASTFGLVGQWNIGQVPAGRRAFVQYGGDLLILSTLGIQPMSFVTRGGEAFLSTDKSDYTEKVQPTFSQESTYSFNQRGWGLYTLNGQNLLISTVPNYGSVLNRQYVMNTITNAWSVSAGIPARCAVVAVDLFFCGTSTGQVLLAYRGTKDNVGVDGSGGTLIQGTIQWAYTDFGAPGMLKSFKMVRPYFVAKQRPSFGVSMFTDFRGGREPEIPATTVPGVVGGWGSAVWGSSVWGSSTRDYKFWRDTPSDRGYYGSLLMKTEVPGGTRILSCDILAQVGGVL